MHVSTQYFRNCEILFYIFNGSSSSMHDVVAAWVAIIEFWVRAINKLMNPKLNKLLGNMTYARLNMYLPIRFVDTLATILIIKLNRYCWLIVGTLNLGLRLATCLYYIYFARQLNSQFNYFLGKISIILRQVAKRRRSVM